MRGTSVEHVDSQRRNRGRDSRPPWHQSPAVASRLITIRSLVSQASCVSERKDTALQFKSTRERQKLGRGASGRAGGDGSRKAPICTSLVVVGSHSAQDSLGFVNVVEIVGFEAVRLHKGGPSPPALFDDLALLGRERRFYSRVGVSRSLARSVVIASRGGQQQN